MKMGVFVRRQIQRFVKKHDIPEERVPVLTYHVVHLLLLYEDRNDTYDLQVLLNDERYLKFVLDVVTITIRFAWETRMKEENNHWINHSIKFWPRLFDAVDAVSQEELMDQRLH